MDSGICPLCVQFMVGREIFEFSLTSSFQKYPTLQRGSQRNTIGLHSAAQGGKCGRTPSFLHFHMIFQNEDILKDSW